MAHTPRALALLAQAASLRDLANQHDRALDRVHGLHGRDAGAEIATLRVQARQIEDTVLIRFVAVPAFDFSARDCAAAYRAAERARVTAAASPRLRAALEDIQRMGTHVSCSLAPRARWAMN